jgi:hypothetical protein
MDNVGGEHRINWRLVRSGPDATAALGQVGQVYFAATWIFSPKDQDVPCEFLGAPHNMTQLRINGEPVLATSIRSPLFNFTVPRQEQTIHFLKGWNEVYVRTYAVGYDLRLGMILRAPPATLWKLRMSPVPPGTPDK